MVLFLSILHALAHSSESLANAFPGHQPDVAYATGRCDDQFFCSEDMWEIALCGVFQAVVTLTSSPRLRPAVQLAAKELDLLLIALLVRR